jgi:hypothetical protein
MPIDADGNRADIITGPDSVPGRMNIGRLHSPYFAAAARDVRKQMLEAIGLPRNWSGRMSTEELQSLPQAHVGNAVELMLKYYSIISPLSYKEYTEALTEEERWVWLREIFNDKMYNFMHFEDPQSLADKIIEIEKHFKLVYGPVTYVGHGGIPVTTNNPVRIAPLDIMLLDKIADDWLATSSGKHSNFGILTARVRADKYMRPWKVTPPRVVGETEGRIYCGYGGRQFVAELIDRNGNIASQREIASNIMLPQVPFSSPTLIDRNKIDYGNTRPLQIFNQVLFCMGVAVKHVKEYSAATAIQSTNLQNGIVKG